MWLCVPHSFVYVHIFNECTQSSRWCVLTALVALFMQIMQSSSSTTTIQYVTLHMVQRTLKTWHGTFFFRFCNSSFHVQCVSFLWQQFNVNISNEKEIISQQSWWCLSYAITFTYIEGCPMCHKSSIFRT